MYLGIDSGTSGIKAVLIDEKGEDRASGYAECDVVSDRPGWAEQDPRDWWRACKEAVTQATASSGLGMEVRAIGFSGQMQGSVMLDKDGEPTGNCLLWLDQRSTQEVREINGIMSPDEYLPITANDCLTSLWAPKILWVKKHRPEEYERVRKVCFTKDYLAFRLTGEIATEVSDASLSFLLDVPGRCWSDVMYGRLGIPRDFAPDRLLESIGVVGQLRKDVAGELGLPAGIPVIAGGGDQPAGGVGTGIVRSGVIGVSIGTSGVVFGCVDAPLIDRKHRALYSMAHSVPGKWSFLGLVLAAGGSFKWLRDTVFADEKAALAAKGQDVYDHMTQLAAQAAPGSEGLTFLPYLNGEKTPIDDADARGVFFGLSQRHGLPEICRSVMEGATFALRETVDICREYGFPVEEIRANGGGAKSALWRQIQADIFGAQVVTMNIEEGTAAGAAILAAVGAGDYGSVEEACDTLLKATSVTEPDARAVGVYNDYYETYKDLYGALRGQFAKQAEKVAKYIE
ncbi:MAG: xylulokinase [Clostridiales Family XIII bacterium]|jgi:xylulokinase|nr:xylulokinase [Clostridiales Family XIII bacterium]